METGLFIACAALTAACALIAVYFMKAFREKTYDRAAILKTAAGLCFLMIGVLFAAGMSGDKRFVWLVAGGLAFGVLGDLLLAIRFIRPAQHDRFFVSGALSFAVGHWLYIYAMLTKYSVSFPVVLTVGIVGLAAAATYVKSKKADGFRQRVYGDGRRHGRGVDKRGHGFCRCSDAAVRGGRGDVPDQRQYSQRVFLRAG